MDLPLNYILNLTNDEIKNSKLELNMVASSGGKPFLDIWLNHTDEEKAEGICKNCSYWGWYGNQRNFSEGKWVFSFARIKNDEWLLMSVGEVVKVPSNTWAEVNIIDRFKPLFGRLIVKFKKGNTHARYTFNLITYINKITVKEILPCIYSGESFEGYDKVHIPFYRLSDVFKGKILPTYYEALKRISGVYCLTDTNTGKLYIGSATGEEGVLQRWGNYLDSKHGGNKKLIALYKKVGAEYFEKYFTFTLLEYFNLSYDPIKVIEREQYWKKCFDTIRNGYNDN